MTQKIPRQRFWPTRNIAIPTISDPSDAVVFCSVVSEPGLWLSTQPSRSSRRARQVEAPSAGGRCARPVLTTRVKDSRGKKTPETLRFLGSRLHGPLGCSVRLLSRGLLRRKLRRFSLEKFRLDTCTIVGKPLGICTRGGCVS